MKKTLLIFAFCAWIFPCVADSSAQALFARGNLLDKTEIVRKFSGDEKIALLGIDFALKNEEFLKNERDLAALVLASVLSFPKSALKNEENAQKIIKIFENFPDDNIRVAILEKITMSDGEALGEKFSKAIKSYLLKTLSGEEKISDATASAILLSPQTFDSAAFEIVFSGLKNPLWENFHEKVILALCDFAVLDLNLAKKIFNSGDFETSLLFFDEILKKSKNLKESCAEVAEIAILSAIINTEEKPFSDKNSSSLVIKALNAILDANWTRASSVVSKIFVIAKNDFLEKSIEENDFLFIVKTLSHLAPPDAASLFSQCLFDFNLVCEKGNPPETHIVLSIIEALGELGDKTAFDNLLCVTYLSYPKEVVVAARSALSKLRW